MASDWYEIRNIDQFDSPALVLYPERITENIRLLKSMIDDVDRLRPHVKTNKCAETVTMMVNEGITKFKCATIAEAEMLAMCKAKDVLLAYQPSLPRLKRLSALIKAWPNTRFSCLADNKESIRQMEAYCSGEQIMLDIDPDLDLGMHRTGIEPGQQALDLYLFCTTQKYIRPVGLHAYDGHLRMPDIGERTTACDAAFERVVQLKKDIIVRMADSTGNEQNGSTKNPLLPEPVIIAGGSPTFPIHARRAVVECSPGTFIYWDRGYAVQCAEQPFIPAALLVTRVISLPGKTRVCLDLGHKSVAAENDIQKRACFLNAPGLTPVAQSEEHLVMEADEQHGYKVGDVLYAVPYHVCPTVALYERSYVSENQTITGEWKHIARDRKISY